MRVLARSGYAVLGIVHIVVGAVALSAATGAGGGEADQSGAMSQISRSPGGDVLLWLMAIGLFALTLWQVVQVVLVRDDDGKKKWGKRGSEASKGVAYLVLGVSSVVFAAGGHQSSQHSTESFSATMLATPGGAFVIVLVGLITLGIGIGFGVLGLTTKFEKQVRMPRQPFDTVVRVIGVAGYVAKGVALAIVGVLFVVAAVTNDARQAGGLDSALKSLRTLPFGEVLLWLAGLGLILYGVYCGIRAVLAKM